MRIVLALLLFSPTFQGIQSADAAANIWSSTGPAGAYIRSLVIAPTATPTIYAGANGSGVYKTLAGSGTWNAVNTGLTNKTITALTVDPLSSSTLYAGTAGNGVFKTTNGGTAWAATGLASDTVNAIAIKSGTIYAGTSAGGIYRSINGGGAWAQVNSGLSNLYVTSVAMSPGFATDTTAFAGTAGGGVFKSTDDGATWTAVNTNLTDLQVTALAISPEFVTLPDNTLYAGTATGGIFKSNNAGTTWAAVNTGLPAGAAILSLIIDHTNANTIFAATSAGVYISLNGGGQWDPPATTTPDNSFTTSLAMASAASIYAGTGGGVYLSTDSGATWSAINSGMTATDARATVISPDSQSKIITGTNGGGIYISSDQAATWASINSGLANSFVQAIAIDPNAAARIYAGTLNGIYRSTNGGTTWTAATVQPTTADIRAIAIDSSVTPATTIYSGSYGGGVFKSLNSGVNWVATTALPDQNVTSLIIDAANTNLYAGTDGGGVFKSSNGGTTWSLVAASNNGLNSNRITALSLTASTLYAATAAGIHSIAVPGGTQWSAINNGINSLDTIALAVNPANPNYLCTGTNGSGVFLSSNQGANWSAINTSLNSLVVRSLAIDSATPTRIYAGTATGGVSSLITSPTITIAPATPHSFGNANTVGPPSSKEITVGNSGTLDLTVSGIASSLTAADGTTFTPVGNGISVGGSSPCSSTTPTIIPGGSCTLLFKFTPGTPAVNSATLQFSSNDTETPTKDLLISWAGGVPPVAAFTAPAGGATIKNPFTITGTALDNSATGLKKVEISLNGGTTWLAASPKPTLTTWEYVWTTPPVTGDGNYTILARATDNKDYVQTALASVAVTLTNTAPDTAIDSSPAVLANLNSATFTFSATKYGIPLGGALFECKLDSGAYAACTTPKTYNGLTDGSHTFSVRATDGALPLPGNVDATPASYTWTVDTTPPITAITAKPALNINSTDASFVFAANEPGCTYICTFDGVGPAPCTSPYNRTTLAEGDHTFTVQATDPAGNQELAPVSYTWRIDVTRPTSNIDAPPAQISGNSHTFTGTASDPVSVVASGVNRVEVSFNGTTWFTATDTAVGPALPWSTWSYLWTLPLNGPYTMLSRAVDNAGNTQQTAANANVVVANPLPTVAITYPADNAIIGSSSVKVISGSAAAGGGLPLQKVQVAFYPSATPPGSPTWFDAVGTTSWSYDWRTTLPSDGIYTVLARSLDSVGNISAIDSSNSRSVTVDVTAPTSAVDQPANPYLQGTQITATGTADDSLSGVASVAVTITDSSNQTVSTGAAVFNTITKTWAYSSSSGLPDGSYTIRSRATDNAGNQQVGQGSATVTLDNVAPITTITSRPVNPSNSSAPSFSFTADHASTFICTLDGAATPCTSPKSYSGLIPGLHIFTVQATDQAGNIESNPPSYSWVVDLGPIQLIDNNPVTPADGATRVNIFNPNITVTFNKPVNPATLTASTFYLTIGSVLVPGTISLNTTNIVATFTPLLPLSYASDYTATVTTGIRDPADNQLVAGRVWSFSTDPDGDINLDGRVDIADALLALRVAIGRNSVSAAALRHGDVAPLGSQGPDPDGIIEGRDVMVILGKSIGKHNW